MSDMKSDDAASQVSLDADVTEPAPENLDHSEGSAMPSPQEEEEAMKKKYGGILPKKPPLISKDHERAYFDSADWALGKQGANPNKPKGPLEALRPKLQPTPHQQVRSRHSAYKSTENEDGSNPAAEDVIQDDTTNDEESKNDQ
ncbi:uncharacterized protein LOC109722241 isoform X2 [Ananas comosus]|nr:uncharacterized protein LOC109722241 isoform X2 [Ananas comosus]